MGGDLVTLGGATLAPGGLVGRLPFARTIELLRCHVAGAHYARVVDFAHELSRGDALTLRREPDNAYDGRAILVLDGNSSHFVFLRT